MSQVSEEKLSVVESTMELLNQFELVGAADLQKVGSIMLQDLRKQLRGQVVIRGVKNTLMKRAMEKAGLHSVEEFFSKIQGQNIFIFSNGNPFKLAMMLHRNKARVFAKQGETAIENIVIPSGNTGLSPGPILSKFGNLGVRTRIEGGNIWVVNDTEVAKAGNEITPDLADILSRLGIRAAEMGLEIKAVYEQGMILTREGLLLDVDNYFKRLTEAYSNAFQVSLKAAFPTHENASTLLYLAVDNARKVAIEAEYITKETLGELLVKARAGALAIKSLVENKI